jgi:hypothetical protein
MVLLKQTLFILNINSSSFFGDAISLIPSSLLLTHRLLLPLLSAIISAPYSTDNRDNNPTLPELLHESINQNQGIDHRLTFAGGCC